MTRSRSLSCSELCSRTLTIVASAIPIATPRFGGHGGGGTPGPIPNPEVKPSSADGTALETEWESRSLPRLRSERAAREGGPFAFPYAGACPARSVTRVAAVPGPPRPPASSGVRSRTRSAARRRRGRTATRCRDWVAIELLDRDDPKAAAAEAEKAKAIAPRSGAVREVLGLALYGLGRWQDALTELKAYKRISGRSDQNHLIADSLRGLGRPQEAVLLAEEVLRPRVCPTRPRPRP